MWLSINRKDSYNLVKINEKIKIKIYCMVIFHEIK